MGAADMELDITRLSASLTVRRLEETDLPQILALCGGNPQYYRYHPPLPSADGIREDMRALPPGKAPEDKFYVGYFAGGALAAVMDLILGYPQDRTALIGFLMVDAGRQGTGLGSRLVGEAMECLRAQGFTRLRLGGGQGKSPKLCILDKERLRAGEREPLYCDGTGHIGGPERDRAWQKAAAMQRLFAYQRCRVSTPAQVERGKNVIWGKSCRSSSNTK